MPALAATTSAHTEPAVLMSPMNVVERGDSGIGTSVSASEGAVGESQFRHRAILRPGELLETVPGLIATQHSGAGKANQFFLRGFNLDHGTDLATSLNGVPLNLPTHGHGQGYTDLNSVIPELVRSVQFRKGPYRAADGDFATVGSVDLVYHDRVPENFARVDIGSFDYRRVVAAVSGKVAQGTLLVAAEGLRQDGPWQRPEAFDKTNAVVRYSGGAGDRRWSVTASTYHGEWNATDQVPARAVESGAIDRFGTVDPDSGGESARHALALDWQSDAADSHTHVTAYVYRYDLDLFSNFTHFLESPDEGDQFEQTDRRHVTGVKAERAWAHSLSGRSSATTAGVQVRHDDIRNGLYQTVARVRTDKVGADGETIPAVTREDDVRQFSAAAYVENTAAWSDLFRTTAGARVDHYRFEIASNLPENSGRRSATLASPRLSLLFGPWDETEFYVNAAGGFHSNDGRGTPTRRDPRSGSDVDPVDPLVRTRTAELGVRTTAVRGVNSSVSIWWIDLDSELLFVGDAGNTEASRPSRRWGIEWANFYRPRSWLSFDLDVSISRARFRDEDPAGNRIPGAVESVVAAGVSVSRGSFGGSFRIRHFGPRALIEDDSARSAGTTLANLRVAYTIDGGWELGAEVLNLFNRAANDIDYFYTSRLPGEPSSGVDDIHFHPSEPRALRVMLRRNF